MKLTLSADGTGILKWWVDASFAVHEVDYLSAKDFRLSVPSNRN